MISRNYTSKTQSYVNRYWKHDDLPMDSDKLPQISKLAQVLNDVNYSEF